MCDWLRDGVCPCIFFSFFIESGNYDDGREKQISSFFVEASQGNLCNRYHEINISYNLTYVLLTSLISFLQLDGSLAGDEGFDPLGLSNIEELGIGEKIIS